MIEKFETRQDVYNFCAQIYLGKENWEKLSKSEKKKYRKNFKTVMLGVLYGMGKQSLAGRLNCDVAEADRVIQALYNAFPRLREYVHEQEEYVMEHEGYINTILGDKLRVPEWKYYKEAKTSYEKKQQEAKIRRLGVNLPIQGGTSTLMSSGFYNDIRTAIEQGWNLTSFVTVHDSNTCDFSADKLWGLWDFYAEYFTKFVYDRSGMTLLFDLLIGVTYQDAAELKVISPDIIELKGNARTLQMIIDSMNECPGLKYEISMNREDIKPKYVESPVDRFIQEKGCSMVMDKSSYSVQFKKL